MVEVEVEVDVEVEVEAGVEAWAGDPVDCNVAGLQATVFEREHIRTGI